MGRHRPPCIRAEKIGPEDRNRTEARWPNAHIPPHTHPYGEVVSLISCTIGTNEGEKFEKKGEMLMAGSLWVYPAKYAHYAWTGNEGAIIQVQFTSPGGIDYINPADDPRKK